VVVSRKAGSRTPPVESRGEGRSRWSAERRSRTSVTVCLKPRTRRTGSGTTRTNGSCGHREEYSDFRGLSHPLAVERRESRGVRTAHPRGAKEELVARRDPELHESGLGAAEGRVSEAEYKAFTSISRTMSPIRWRPSRRGWKGASRRTSCCSFPPPAWDALFHGPKPTGSSSTSSASSFWTIVGSWSPTTALCASVDSIPCPQRLPELLQQDRQIRAIAARGRKVLTP